MLLQRDATVPIQIGAVASVERDVANSNRDTDSKLGHARLHATFDSGEDPQVTHHKSEHTVTPKTRVEQWERQRSLGCTVSLEKSAGVLGCVEVNDDDQRWYRSDDQIGELRAVKRMQKAKKQSYLSGASVRQLKSLALFSGPAYEYYFVKSSGWYESPSNLFIAMEYCPLGDMQSYLLDHGPVPEAEAKHIGRQIFSGIEFLHANNYVRRDLKPANLLIKSWPPTVEWWVKIADFGFCKDMKELAAPSNDVCDRLEFMPPEVHGFDVGDRNLSELDKGKAVDMWAAGETMFRILTGKASFGDNSSLLMQYTKAQARFPNNALLQAGVSFDGVAFIEQCMARKPSKRPSATYALQNLRWQRSPPNAFKGWEAHVTRVMHLRDGGEPFVLFGPDMNDLFVVTSRKIFLWDMGSMEVVRTSTSNSSQNQNWEFSQASMSPDGICLCVTQAQPLKPSLIFNAKTLELLCEIPDRMETRGQGAKISTFSPDGKHLIIACKDLLSHFATSESTGSWSWIETYPDFLGPAHDVSAAMNIKSMAFTKDGNRLVAAYENMVVIKDTSGPYVWEDEQIIKYPGSASAVAVSPCGTIVACGTDKGELWLWTSEINCWMRRVCPMGGPHSADLPIDRICFSNTGLSLMFTGRGRSTVSLIRTIPLNQRDSAMDFAEFGGRSIGQTAFCPGRAYGATALGGEAGEQVVMWRYKKSCITS